ncbi:hypothetical protein ACFO3O_09060 [Dokdonia ponticola]|uniref:EVE domain-containing protein n=1 Tax=Dokdonia ponticola TaxID=2041041 RepID=A0ABV9HYF5_9FLAO
MTHIKRLYDKKHFDKILEHNQNDIENWEKFYPNHRDWIKKAIFDLKENNFRRIAFGGFYIEHRYRTDVLCASAIVKKNPFTPYLEIKNLVVFDQPDNEIYPDFEYKIKDLIIKHIKGYAQQRGFPKLVTELVNKDTKDRELIKLFLDNNFIISGKQYSRYKENDDIVYLICSINPIYGFDPYDNESLTKWLLNKYLKCDHINGSERKSAEIVEYLDELDDIGEPKKKLKKKKYLEFYTGKNYLKDIESKFNFKRKAILLEEYYAKNNSFTKIDEISLGYQNDQNCFLFNFCDIPLSKDIISKYIVFEKSEIDTLSGINKERDYQNRFPYKNVGGFVLISNKEKFPFNKLRENFKSNTTSVYIKLGSVGKYVTPDMPLYLAYYPTHSNKNTLKVWGKIESIDEPDYISLEKLSNKSQVNHNTYGEHLFDRISHTESKPLWTLEQFDEHNSYNATNHVICFYFKNIELFSEFEEIDLDLILDDKSYFNDIEKIFDFYLSKNEVNQLNKIIEESNNYRNKNLVASSDDNIPNRFRIEIEQQLNEQYKELARYRRKKSDQLDDKLKEKFQKEIENTKKNITEIKEDFLILIVESGILNKQKIEQQLKYISESIENKFTDISIKLSDLKSSNNEVNENILKIRDTLDVDEVNKDEKTKKDAEQLVGYVIEKVKEYKLDIKEEIIKEEDFFKLNTSAKLKLSIPIIPAILKYEADLLKISADDNISSWKDLYRIFFKRKK